MTAAASESARAAPQVPSEQSTGVPYPIQKRELWRFWMLVFGFSILALVVLASLLVHQVLQMGQDIRAGTPHQAASPRGVILDRNGAVLAADRYFYEVSATPENLNNDADRMAVAEQLQALAGLPAQKTFDLLRTYAEAKYVRLAPAISLEAGQRILDEQAKLAEEAGAHPLFHVFLTPAPERYYPEQTLAAHLLGILALVGDTPWQAGVYGVEGYYDRFLRVRDGVGLIGSPDAELDDLPANLQEFLPSAAGKDLILTIDRNVQWIIEEELERALAQYRAQAGTIIVMDPRSGEILAMANRPVFDPNQIEESDIAALQNPAVSAQYEPGSVFKVITAAAALDADAVTATELFTDTGSIAVGHRVFLNSDRAGHGQVDMTRALALSLNVVTAQWALVLGETQFYQYLDRFGFGEVTGVDLAGEVYGLVKKPGSLDWSLSDLGANSFGQGLAVTPLQMLNAVASIANGGKLMKPYVVKARIWNGQVQYTRPTVMGTTVRPEVAAELTKILEDVVRNGNSAAGVAGYSIAGKSGTAQIPTEEGYTEDETMVTFAGFAPADDPQLAILVKLDRPDPTISRWASYTAAPVFAQVARRLFYYYGLPPDDIRLGKAPVAGG